MMSVLVVDDSAVDRLLVGNLLRCRGYFEVEFASDGAEALERLEDHLPTAVVTDMQMPVMDGLTLVREATRRFPSVPVILMTAFGTADTALEALRSGAADYVPKQRLAVDLCPAVRAVLSAAKAAGHHRRLAPYLKFDENRYELENDPRLIADLVAETQATVEALRVAEPAEIPRLARAVEEALRNAMFHGNLELGREKLRSLASRQDDYLLAERRRQAPYCDRRVSVHAVYTGEEARLTIRDEGPGFDHRLVEDLQSDPNYLVSGVGRGLVLARTFMDEVRFNDQGNEVTLVKRRARQCPAAAADCVA